MSVWAKITLSFAVNNTIFHQNFTLQKWSAAVQKAQKKAARRRFHLSQ
jgi:hypothetical protein